MASRRCIEKENYQTKIADEQQVNNFWLQKKKLSNNQCKNGLSPTKWRKKMNNYDSQKLQQTWQEKNILVQLRKAKNKKKNKSIDNSSDKLKELMIK